MLKHWRSIPEVCFLGIMPGVCAKSQNILLLQIHKYSNLQGKKYNGFKIPLELPWLPWGRCSWGQIRKATKYQITFKRSPVGSKWTERSLVWDELLWWKTNSKVRWWFCWSIFCNTHKAVICYVREKSYSYCDLMPWGALNEETPIKVS